MHFLFVNKTLQSHNLKTRRACYECKKSVFLFVLKLSCICYYIICITVKETREISMAYSNVSLWHHWNSEWLIENVLIPFLFSFFFCTKSKNLFFNFYFVSYVCDPFWLPKAQSMRSWPSWSPLKTASNFFPYNLCYCTFNNMLWFKI